MDLGAVEGSLGKSRLSQSTQRPSGDIRLDFKKPSGFMLHLALHVARRSFGDDPTRIHQRKVIAMFGFGQIMSGDQDRNFFFARQPRQDIPEMPPTDRVDA